MVLACRTWSRELGQAYENPEGWHPSLRALTSCGLAVRLSNDGHGHCIGAVAREQCARALRRRANAAYQSRPLGVYPQAPVVVLSSAKGAVAMPFSMQGWDKVLEMLEQRLGKRMFRLMLYMIWAAILSGCVGLILDQVAIRAYEFFDRLFTGKIRIFDNSPQIFATILVLAALFVVLWLAARLILSLTKRRVPQSAIDELARHRDKGITVLNDIPSGE